MCHCRPRDLVVKYLEYSYLQKFLISPMFKNYIKELIGTITVSSDLPDVDICTNSDLTPPPGQPPHPELHHARSDGHHQRQQRPQ